MRLKRLKINSGIAQDLKGRAPWYKHDWVEGINCSYRYMLCAAVTVLPKCKQLISRYAQHTYTKRHTCQYTCMQHCVFVIIPLSALQDKSVT